METITPQLKSFAEERKLYYATEAFLRESFGVVIRSNNPDCPDNDYFLSKESDFMYVKTALENISTIFPIGNISTESLKKKKTGGNTENRYDTIKVFACEAKDSLCREDISALTRAFNRIDSVIDNDNNRKNRPVIVLFRQNNMLSISTCERIAKNEGQDTIGRVLIMHNIDCEKPRQGHIQILKSIADGLKKCFSFDELYETLIKCLSIDIVSDNFFKGYRNLFKEIVDFTNKNKQIKVAFSHFPDAEKAIRDYVKILMGRLVFVQFLQRKGWMGVPVEDETWTKGDPEFLQTLFDNTDQKQRFVVDVLQPLFQDLNTKRQGDIANERIGEGIKIPYLNGGLFEKDEYSSIQFSLPEDLMGKLLEFFRSYNFTIDENAQDSAEVGVDPEMLSRIFESLLEDNKEKGAFYTPKEVVEYMCREALTSYLQAGVVGNQEKQAIKIFVETKKADELGEALSLHVEQKLRDVKVCDPAIGSGAFPMGMLKELFECRMSIVERRHEEKCNPTEIKKDIIQNSLYGVDIEKGAVDIARLRFWLALIIDEETPHALPNMDFKIMQGNSLLERYEGVDFSNIQLSNQEESKPATKKRRKKKVVDNQQSLALEEKDALENIQIAIRDYYRTDSHQSKLMLRDSINFNVKEYIIHQNDCAINIRKKIDALPIPNDKFFLWHIYFKEVFDKGGFDIVIGNPPYIELQKMKEMSAVYASCGFETYNKSGDIYCLFTEHGFNLLKKGGLLCYIMPNKWMKAAYGRELRKYILAHEIYNIVDFGDVQIFKNATTYPCIVLLGKDEPQETFTASRLREFDMHSIEGLTQTFETSEFGEDTWVVTSKKDQLLFTKLKKAFPALKEFLNGASKYGIKPGCSEAFLISKEIKDRLVAANQAAEEVIVPFLSGRDIKTYEKPEPSNYLILFKKGDTLRLIGKSEASEQEAWGFIAAKYPSVCQWLSKFEVKARARADKGDYWWELRACDYYCQFPQSKIMYQTFQVKPNFIYDTDGCYCNNSMWILPTENKALLGLFNSKIAWWMISNYCSQIQSGYQLIWEYFSRIPIALNSDGDPEISELVDKILEAKKLDNTADITVYQQEIEGCLYELYGLTNEEVNVIDPERVTFGGAFELFGRKSGYHVVSNDEIDRVYYALRDRFNKISNSIDVPDRESSGSYDLTKSDKPSKEDLEDAFIKWNCGILTSFRGQRGKSFAETLERNKRRNEELKSTMSEQGLRFRPVDGYYYEIQEGDSERKQVLVNEFSFFITNTDAYGKIRREGDEEKDFFRHLYRLAEHYEQDSFLFTFPGNNRVAFLVATNDNCREYFRNDIRFAGPLYEGIEEPEGWTGCSNDGKIVFKLKGLVQMKVPHSKVWVAEGDLFEVTQYNPDCLVIVHNGKNEDFVCKCAEYQKKFANVYETVIADENCTVDNLKAAVISTLNRVQKGQKVIGFHGSVDLNNSYEQGANVIFDTVKEWAEINKKTISKLIIVDLFGDYLKLF